MENVKTTSSKWLKTLSPDLGLFSWQRGYGAFSVEPAYLDSLLACIDGQEAHHRTQTFQDEFRTCVAKHKIDYDETCVRD